MRQKRKTKSPKNSCNDLMKISNISQATITSWILCMCAALRGSSWPMAYKCICRTYSASSIKMLIRLIAILYELVTVRFMETDQTDCISNITVISNITLKSSAKTPTVVNAQTKKWIVHGIYRTRRTGRHGLFST